MAIRTGRFTITLPSRPVVQGFAAVAGKKEGEGPLAAEFDHIFDDTTLGEVSWEKAESKLHREAVIRALSKAQKSPADVDVIFAGDLLSQCIGTCFGIRELDMPFAGLYGACSTMALSLLMASVFIDTGTAGLAVASTSSHFCSAERQYRFPLAYGGQRTPTAQWTATAAGAAVLGSEPVPNGAEPCDVRVTHVLFGRMVEMGVTDAANMGAAMAPEDVNLDPYIFRRAERCVLQKIRYYQNHSLAFPLERTETENRQSHLIPYLTSSGILSVQMFFLSKHRR